jgi:hypothetical protein
MKDGSAYFMPFCGKKGHLKFSVVNQQDLKRGKHTPHTLATNERLNIEELYFRPPGHKNMKCKYLQWLKYLEELEDDVDAMDKVIPSAQAQRRSKPKTNTFKAVEDWQWVGNIDKWMNTEGKVVRMSSLETAEMICAINAIIDVNFSRVTKRIAWVKQLLKPIKTYEYPKEELDVGVKVAGEKLEEFQDAAEEKGLI